MSLPFPRPATWSPDPREPRQVTTEGQLIHGYSGIARSTGNNVPRSEPCACGGTIDVEIQTEAFIQAAVRRHQAFGLHREWSRREYGP